MGVGVRQPREGQITAVHSLTSNTLKKIGTDNCSSDIIMVDDGYVDKGYGTPDGSTL